jgi:1,6-anhydro-N-acetylmuramate kinase
VNPTESLWDSSQRGGSTIDGLVGQMKQRVRRTRTTLDNARPGTPECLVTLHRIVKFFDAACIQQLCQGYRILNRKIGPLPMMGKHAVRGVTQQHNASALPGLEWPDREQTPAKIVDNRAYHFDNGWMPALESRDGLVVGDRRNPILLRPG